VFFYNKNLNPNEALDLSTYTTEVPNDLLKYREARPSNSRWNNSLSITCSTSFRSSWLGWLHSDLVWLMEKCSNWRGVNEEELPPGELQYCSNNATTPGASCLYLYQPRSSYKLGSDGAVCTSTSPCRSCHLVSWHKSVKAWANLYSS